MTKNELLEMMNGKRVIKEAINLMTIEENEELKKSIIDALEENGKTLDDFIETENTFEVKGYINLWRKSKLKKKSIGILKIYSKNYEFIEDGGKKGSWGDIPTKENFIKLENGFVNAIKFLDDGNYQGFKYTLED